jgi:hypothetical protein
VPCPLHGHSLSQASTLASAHSDSLPTGFRPPLPTAGMQMGVARIGMPIPDGSQMGGTHLYVPPVQNNAPPKQTGAIVPIGATPSVDGSKGKGKARSRAPETFVIKWNVYEHSLCLLRICASDEFGRARRNCPQGSRTGLHCIDGEWRNGEAALERFGDDGNDCEGCMAVSSDVFGRPTL